MRETFCLRGTSPRLDSLDPLRPLCPMASDASAIARARGAGFAACADPILEPVTEESFGFLIWQEQVVRALTEQTGFDGDNGDRVRRILCRKRPGEIEEARDLFVSGCMQLKGVPEHRAQAVWHELEKNSTYAISKVHVVAHRLLTHRMAYLKAHWPCEFEKAVGETRHEGRGQA